MTPPAETARQAAIRIIADLRTQGHTAYLAGGCVRDQLMGKTPKDYDIATDATPKAVQALYPRRSAAVGAAFGVVIVYTPKPTPRHRWVTEVATFRAEGTYSDGRRPDSVRFTDAREDAKRRDFTINGLFGDPPDPDADTDDPDAQPDRIIDFVNGLADLDAKLIRAIGDPDERFGEDYLRMLRAVRFAARLGFEIDPKTSAAIRVNARYLGQISRERIGHELIAMLKGPHPATALRLLQELKLDGPTLNEDTGDPPLALSEQLDNDADPATRLAAWLIDRHGSDKPHAAVLDRWRKALSMSNEHRDEINRLMTLQHQLDKWDTLGVAGRKRLANQPAWHEAMLLYQARKDNADAIRGDVEALLNDGIGIAPPPLLTGDDLIAQGLKPGPAFKTLLDHAYDRQLEGELTSRDQALAWLKRQ